MVGICFYFEVHQPFRLADYRIRQIGSHDPYFDEEKNKAIFQKVAQKCYLPAGLLFASLLRRYPETFKVSFSMTGTFLEQCALYEPKVLELYQDILSLPNTEILCETSHHSLAALKDPEEFLAQVEWQKHNVQKYFNRTPTAFRNTELIYSNAIGELVHQAGFNTCLLEGWDPVLPAHWNAQHVFSHHRISELKLLPKSYQLSDDVAFRFSNRSWPAWPLTAEKYKDWFHKLLTGQHEFVGLFMDYETFGEHQWVDTGIFQFVERFVEETIHDNHFSFMTVSEVAAKFPARAPMDVHNPLSWADMDRSLDAWLSNGMQQDALEKAFALKDKVYATKSTEILETWRKLLTSDHFYYMYTKWTEDGDVHRYFSPYKSPYEAYLNYINILDDLSILCETPQANKSIVV